MYIEPDPPRRSRFVIATIVVSVLFHVGVSAGLSEMSPPKPKAVSYHVAFDPPPPPPPPPMPEPEKPKPKPKAPEPEPAPKVEEPSKAAEPVKEVFGVTKDSVAEDSSFAVRVGNTLMAEQEQTFTDPAKVKTLAPVAEKKPAVKVASPPRLRSSDAPNYPPMARESGREGRVVLRVLIDENGRVRELKVISEDPPEMGFGDAAMAAVRRWVYAAPDTGSEVWFFQPVRFSLEN
ncbi:MAG: TonB family protein [Deltaproteobacteria bacterium]|nr:TonB family protein [Deltaproteobacteria bacterium]